jgi:hypothetical protein
MTNDNDYFIILDDNAASKIMYTFLLNKVSSAAHKVVISHEEEFIDLINSLTKQHKGNIIIDRNLLKMNAFDLLKSIDLSSIINLSNWQIKIMSALFSPDDELRKKEVPFDIELIEKPLTKNIVTELENAL